jgi:RNA polymerase sigma-70 factor (ECF subfamily)
MKVIRNNTPFQVPDLERDLVTRCLSGDRQAQRQLYDRYKDAMYTLCYRISNDHEQAADALQEAFIGVFRGLPAYRYASTLGAWIRTIVVRTAYKKLRREVSHEPLETASGHETLDWGVHLDAEILEKAIQSLPAGYRAVFVLIEVEGYSHKEAAELLGISVGTSKSQLYYAKRQLQQKLTALGIRA